MLLVIAGLLGLVVAIKTGYENSELRWLRYQNEGQGLEEKKKLAVIWQQETRRHMLRLLRISDLLEADRRPSLNPAEISQTENDHYSTHVVEINTTHDRRLRLIVTRPKNDEPRHPAIIVLAGHYSELGAVYTEDFMYHRFGETLAKARYVTLTLNISRHNIYDQRRTLTGERLWDLIRGLDYLTSLDYVDSNHIGCAGLSLGGQMAMWLAAVDARIAATLVAGFLTKMEQVEQIHCQCWKFAHLRHWVDFADIYCLIAPRPLMCQHGTKELPQDLPITVAREAFEEIRPIYDDFDVADQLYFDEHPGAHEVETQAILKFFKTYLRPASDDS